MRKSNLKDSVIKYLNRRAARTDKIAVGNLLDKFPEASRTTLSKYLKEWRQSKVKGYLPRHHKPTGQGQSINDGALPDALYDKKRQLEDLGYDVDARESIDNKLVYITLEMNWNKTSLDQLRMLQPYYYRLSCKYSTTLRITSEYRVLTDSNSVSYRYRFIGTYIEPELIPAIIFTTDEQETVEANKIFGREVLKINALSVVIFTEGRRKDKIYQKKRRKR